MCHVLCTFSALISSLKCCGDASCIIDDKFISVNHNVEPSLSLFLSENNYSQKFLVPSPIFDKPD